MGPVGLVDPWVWWGCWSGRTVGLVGLWVWWACGSGGPVGLMGPWVWWILLMAKSPTLRGPTCQGVLGLVSKTTWLPHLPSFYDLVPPRVTRPSSDSSYRYD